ncbi:hypothetical protein [Nonomuraea insulae]|uniref:CHAD domain-containing protein n=1 Tax=Nonomuraea insulae TaxID=1616787 RepID=A0ABW1CW79_9ACTN
MAEPFDNRRTALIEAEPVTDAGTADSIRDEIRDFAHLGGFKLQSGATPWHGAALHTAEQAHHAADLAARLHSHLLPLLAYRVGQACTRAGLREPGNHRERTERLRLFAGVAQTMRLLSPRVFEAGPARLAEATGEGGPAGRRARYPGRRKRHALRERARALWLGAGNPERGDLHAALARAAEQLAE